MFSGAETSLCAVLQGRLRSAGDCFQAETIHFVPQGQQQQEVPAAAHASSLMASEGSSQPGPWLLTGLTGPQVVTEPAVL